MAHRDQKITLHQIADEIHKVQNALKVARQTAPLAKRAYLDLKLKELDTIEKATHQCCTKSWNLWPDVEVTVAARLDV